MSLIAACDPGGRWEMRKNTAVKVPYVQGKRVELWLLMELNPSLGEVG